MHGRKIYRLLQKLSPDDWRDFEAYLKSPLLGNSQLYAKFLAVFKEVRLGERDHTLVSVHEVIYPISEFPDFYATSEKDGSTVLAEGREGHMKRHFSGLLEKLVDFWGFQQSQSDVAAQHAYRLRGLAEHEEVSAFEKQWQKANSSRLGHNESTHSAICNTSRLLDGAIQAILMTELQKNPVAKKTANPFQEAIDLLDEGYLLTAIDLACKAKNHDVRRKKESQDNHIPPRFLDLQRINVEMVRSPLARILLPLYKMNTDADKHRYFQEAKSALLEVVNARPKNPSMMLEDLMSHLINFAARQLQEHPYLYHSELQLIYETALQAGIFLREGRLSRQHYQNAASIFLKIKSYDWVAEFLVNYKHQLPEHLQDVVFDFNWGRLQFGRGNFKAAWQSLIRAENDHKPAESLEFSMQLRTLQVVLEYEIGDYERFLARSTNLTKWLKTTRGLPKGRVAGYLLFTRFTKKMARLRLDRPSEANARKWKALGLKVSGFDKETMIMGAWLHKKLGVE
jgi:hypothetical protein